MTHNYLCRGNQVNELWIAKDFKNCAAQLKRLALKNILPSFRRKIMFIHGYVMRENENVIMNLELKITQ